MKVGYYWCQELCNSIDWHFLVCSWHSEFKSPFTYCNYRIIKKKKKKRVIDFLNNLNLACILRIKRICNPMMRFLNNFLVCSWHFEFKSSLTYCNYRIIKKKKKRKRVIDFLNTLNLACILRIKRICKPMMRF